MAQPTLASRFCAVTGCSVHSFRIILLRLFKSTNIQRRSLKEHRHRVVVNTPKRYMLLRVGLKDKAARVGFEPGPTGRKVLNLPLSHHTPLYYGLAWSLY